MSSGRLHEAERDQVDAEREPELQIALIFLGDVRSQRHMRRVDALVLAELAAVDHARVDLVRRRRLDLELHLAVVQQQAIALLHLERQLAIGRRHAAGLADLVADGDDQRVAFLERNRLAAFQPAGADLRAAQVLQNRHVAVGAPGGGANAIEHAGVIRLRAMREVQAHDVDAGRDQRVEDGRIGRCRSDGRNDLRVPHPPKLML